MNHDAGICIARRNDGWPYAPLMRAWRLVPNILRFDSSSAWSGQTSNR